jgi:hypothetical protein
MGHKQTSATTRAMSAIPSKVDIAERDRDVRFGADTVAEVVAEVPHAFAQPLSGHPPCLVLRQP